MQLGRQGKAKKYSCCSLVLMALWLLVNISYAVEPQPVSLDFQNIEVRAALKILAEFMGSNVVISNTVKGQISLHIHDLPWDEVLAFILTTQGLAKRQIGHIIFIAPAAEINAQQQASLQIKQAIKQSLPLYTRLFQINYSNVSAYYDLLKNTHQTLLSARGKVVQLKANNSLIVTDTRVKLSALAQLFKKLDQPVKQVLIEARIIYISTSYEQTLGINWWGRSSGDKVTYQGFNMDFGTDEVAGDARRITTPFRLGNFLGAANLDLELQAIEAEGKGELISSPRILTSDNVTASIQQGQQIPYSASSASGGTTTLFVQALLCLEVTPQITPNNKLRLALTVTQNQVDKEPVAKNQQPPINTRQLKTNILVSNGSTIVLGGIYEKTNTLRSVRIPWISHLPFIGGLFKLKTDMSAKSELLIFLTPKIVKVAPE